MGLNSQLRWLTTVCLDGFDRNVQQLFTGGEKTVAVVFDGMLLEFSPLPRLQPAAECNLITALTHGDKLEVGG